MREFGLILMYNMYKYTFSHSLFIPLIFLFQTILQVLKFSQDYEIKLLEIVTNLVCGNIYLHFVQ